MRNYLLIAILLCVQPLFAQNPPEKYTDIWMEIGPGGNTSVEKKLAKLRKQNPNDPWIYWISGINCNNEQAAVFYKQAIAIDSTFPHAYFHLAILNEETTEAALNETIDLYTKAVTYDSTLGYAYLYRGEAYLELGQYDKAVADCELSRKCEDMFQLEVDRVELEILWKQGKKEEAYALARKTNFDDGMWPTDFEILLGTLYTEIGDRESACAAYRRAEVPYRIREEEIPEEIQKGLNKCK
jgi:tetratricopeptide (TPR) repeat protein